MRPNSFVFIHAAVQYSRWAAAQDVIAITGPMPLAGAPVATGVVTNKYIPFDLDFLSLPDHQSVAAFAKASTSDWQTSVSVYEEDGQIDTLVDVSWPVGQGPDAKPLTSGDAWSACVIALPQLFTTLGINGPGNGSCFDVVESRCLSSVISEALNRYGAGLASQDYPSVADQRDACRIASELHLGGVCFGKPGTDDLVALQGYGQSNPFNGRPFVAGVDSFTSGGAVKDKAQALSLAKSRAWPVVIVQAQGNVVVQAAVSCPVASSAPGGVEKTTPSTDGTCGGLLRYRCTDTEHFYGQCCSSRGRCGYSSEACSPKLGCQLGYGQCDSVVTVTGSPTPTPTTPANGITTPQPTQPGMVKNCNKFHYIWPGNTCEQVAGYNGISQEDFMKWNTNIRKDCSGIIFDANACVGVLPARTTSATPTSTAPPNSVETPQPTQPGMVKNCNAFHYIYPGNTCGQITSYRGISQDNFSKWNTNIKSDCSGLVFDAYACVGVLPQPTTTATPTSTVPANGVETPQPTQPNMVKNCNVFHYIYPGNTCSQITSYRRISQEDFVEWNPEIGLQCTGLKFDAYACVGVLPAPTTTAPSNAVQTPQPTQPGMVRNCVQFHYIYPGNTCGQITSYRGISQEDFVRWNTNIKQDCSGLKFDAYACVKVA